MSSSSCSLDGDYGFVLVSSAGTEGSSGTSISPIRDSPTGLDTMSYISSIGQASLGIVGAGAQTIAGGVVGATGGLLRLGGWGISLVGTAVGTVVSAPVTAPMAVHSALTERRIRNEKIEKLQRFLPALQSWKNSGLLDNMKKSLNVLCKAEFEALGSGIQALRSDHSLDYSSLVRFFVNINYYELVHEVVSSGECPTELSEEEQALLEQAAQLYIMYNPDQHTEKIKNTWSEFFSEPNLGTLEKEVKMISDMQVFNRLVCHSNLGKVAESFTYLSLDEVERKNPQRQRFFREKALLCSRIDTIRYLKEINPRDFNFDTRFYNTLRMWLNLYDVKMTRFTPKQKENIEQGYARWAVLYDGTTNYFTETPKQIKEMITEHTSFEILQAHNEENTTRLRKEYASTLRDDAEKIDDKNILDLFKKDQTRFGMKLKVGDETYSLLDTCSSTLALRQHEIDALEIQLRNLTEEQKDKIQAINHQIRDIKDEVRQQAEETHIRKVLQALEDKVGLTGNWVTYAQSTLHQGIADLLILKMSIPTVNYLYNDYSLMADKSIDDRVTQLTPIRDDNGAITHVEVRFTHTTKHTPALSIEKDTGEDEETSSYVEIPIKDQVLLDVSTTYAFDLFETTDGDGNVQPASRNYRFDKILVSGRDAKPDHLIE